MFLIDTNVLLADILSRYQDEATRKYLQHYRKIPLIKRVIADFVITELDFYLKTSVLPQTNFKVSEKIELHDITQKYIQQVILHCTIVPVSKRIMQSALSLYQHDLRFSSCLLLTTASHFSYEVVSLDAKTNRLAQDFHIQCFRSHDVPIETLTQETESTK